MFEGGVLEKLRHKKQMISQGDCGILSDVDKNKVIGLEDIYGAAIILSSGICCALVVLVLECLKNCIHVCPKR